MCSGSLKTELGDAKIKEAMAGRRPLSQILTEEQRGLLSAQAPQDLGLEDLAVLGPINVLKLKFVPEGYDRRLVAEVWYYPDGSRVLELSTKCVPAEAFEVAARTRVFLASHGIDLLAEQVTKTKTALEFFAKELSAESTEGQE